MNTNLMDSMNMNNANMNLGRNTSHPMNMNPLNMNPLNITAMNSMNMAALNNRNVVNMAMTNSNMHTHTHTHTNPNTTAAPFLNPSSGPWERIGNDVRYKTWLTDAQITPREYDGASMMDRRSLRSQYEKEVRDDRDGQRNRMIAMTAAASGAGAGSASTSASLSAFASASAAARSNLNLRGDVVTVGQNGFTIAGYSPEELSPPKQKPTVKWKSYLLKCRQKNQRAYKLAMASPYAKRTLELKWICEELDTIAAPNCPSRNTSKVKKCHCLSILYSRGSRDFPDNHTPHDRKVAREAVATYILDTWIPLTGREQKAVLMDKIREARRDPRGYNGFDYGYHSVKALEKHVQQNTVPIHANSGRISGNALHAEKVVHPLIKKFFETVVLPLATPIVDGNNENDSENENENTDVILELDSGYSQRGLYREFAWRNGWSIVPENTGKLPKVPRTDDSWEGGPPRECGSKSTFVGYWEKYYPNLRIADCEDSLERARQKHERGIRTGPWSKAEKEAFRRGFERYGKNWKKISETFVKTRTNLQIQNHARQYKASYRHKSDIRDL
eukprot:jgi/Psemu1/324027/estExt_fgenesh1_pg.C_1120011